MEIKTKYEIGQRIWVVYEDRGEVCVYDDYIDEICVNDNGMYYMLREACIDRAEQDIVLYEDTDKLIEKIKQVMQEIREKEGVKDE